MKAGGFVLGLSIVAMAPASSSAQSRTPQIPQITPMGPTLMRPPAAAPMVPPAVNVQPSPQTISQTHFELVCNVDNFCRNVPVTVCSQ